MHIDMHPGDDERLIRLHELVSGLVKHFRQGDAGAVMKSLHQIISLGTGLSLSCELRGEGKTEEENLTEGADPQG